MKERITNKEMWEKERMDTKKETEKGVLVGGQSVHIGLFSSSMC